MDKAKIFYTFYISILVDMQLYIVCSSVEMWFLKLSFIPLFICMFFLLQIFFLWNFQENRIRVEESRKIKIPRLPLKGFFAPSVEKSPLGSRILGSRIQETKYLGSRILDFLIQNLRSRIWIFKTWESKYQSGICNQKTEVSSGIEDPNLV